LRPKKQSCDIEAADRPFQQLANDRLGDTVPGQCIQISLDDDGGRLFVHR
jgi:hypothetical protein